MIIKTVINEQSLPSKFAWIDDNSFSCISWTKDPCYSRMLKLWDIRNTVKEINSIKIDYLENVCTPFIDREFKLIYTLGKEEKSIYVYDYSESKLTKILKYDSAESSTYSVKFDGKYSDINKSEIDKFARYSKQSNKIHYVSFIVNNKEVLSAFLSSQTENQKSKLKYEQRKTFTNIQNKIELLNEKEIKIEQNKNLEGETNETNKEKKSFNIFDKRKTYSYKDKILTPGETTENQKSNEKIDENKN